VNGLIIRPLYLSAGLALLICVIRAEGFAFAVLMSIINLSTALADNLGSYLFHLLWCLYCILAKSAKANPEVGAIAPPPPDTR